MHSKTLFATVSSLVAILASGCATRPATIMGSASNAIVIAGLDLRNTDGRVVSDNAGMFPSTIGRAFGPLGTMAGAVLDFAAGTAINAASAKAIETYRPMVVKVIFEKSCGDWDFVTVRTAVNPVSNTLGPGSIVKLNKDPDSGQWSVIPVMNEENKPTYLSKAHPCYPAWVTEWKEHQRIVKNRAEWTLHRSNLVIGGVNLANIPEPDIEYIK